MPDAIYDDGPGSSVIVSGFSDEIAASKDIDQQLSVISALGLDYCSLRFVSIAGGPVKNTVDLSNAELARVRDKLGEYGVRVSSLGSPIGKVKLLDQEDGSTNQFVPWPTYLGEHVRRACEVANELGTKLLRAFSFYHPKGTNAKQHISLACERLAEIAEVVADYGLILGLEVEANLVGHTGTLLAEIYETVANPHLVLVFDGANLVTQGFTEGEVYEEYLAMKNGLGWIHVKDYRLAQSKRERDEYVDEEALNQFVPVGVGDGAYGRVFADLASNGKTIFDRCQALGLPGLFIDLEPHLKKGGQFGGFSGPAGFGIACRALIDRLNAAGLRVTLRDWPLQN
ncbi:MAG TPA: TIM barrel protein [Pirellulaceae bacterium]|nr:TIM barrel protein [Pirellulaceae bacterium]HMO90784.1 TIM barrel protein [Pirellulaceae bacterium]HMP68035.1 TIM barrel protein [Pirellulaceae bacterium]